MLQLINYHKGRASESQSMIFGAQSNCVAERRRFDADASDIMHIGDGDIFSMGEFEKSPKMDARKNKNYQKKLGKITVGSIEHTVDMLSESRDFLIG